LAHSIFGLIGLSNNPCGRPRCFCVECLIIYEETEELEEGRRALKFYFGIYVSTSVIKPVIRKIRDKHRCEMTGCNEQILNPISIRPSFSNENLFYLFIHSFFSFCCSCCYVSVLFIFSMFRSGKQFAYILLVVSAPGTF
jgi:hypothetical protein